MNKNIAKFAPVLALSAALMATVAQGSTVSSDDESFLKNAAQGGHSEVELGRLASQKAASPAVKRFAQRMIRDHSKANQQLNSLAASKGVDLHSGQGLGNDATYVKLKILSGREFDKAYINAMVDDHREDVSAFEKASNDARDPDVKNFASKTLPTLKEHLSSIEKLQTEFGTK